MGNKRPKRQPGSLKVWYNEQEGTFWHAVDVHQGRVTRRVRGPEGISIEHANTLLNDALKGRVTSEEDAEH